MKVTIKAGGHIKGKVAAIPSKSHVHRLLILAALSHEKTHIQMPKTQAIDIWATIRCLEALGAKIVEDVTGLLVTPIDRDNLPQEAILPVEESGSTLRFLVPVVAALGIKAQFHMAGRLPQRPMEVLEKAMGEKGIVFSREVPHVLKMSGKLQGGDYFITGNISSQYITGLLFALVLLEADSKLFITGNIESEDYIILSTDTMTDFGFTPKRVENAYEIPSTATFQSPGKLIAQGDWSNAAFWLSAGAMPGCEVQMEHLQANSKQGDKEVVDILAQIGVTIAWQGEILQARENKRVAVCVNAIPIPDLIPVLSAVLAVSKGKSQVKNAGRLRDKESDRLHATATVLNTLGAKVTEEENGLSIEGLPHLKGGVVDSFGDHRIAMMAAIASLACTQDVVVLNAQAVNKSYPTFWQEFSQLGKEIIMEAD